MAKRTLDGLIENETFLCAAEKDLINEIKEIGKLIDTLLEYFLYSNCVNIKFTKFNGLGKNKVQRIELR